MLSKKISITIFFCISLAGFIFTGIFYLIQRPKVDTHIQEKQITQDGYDKNQEKAPAKKEIFNPKSLNWLQATSAAPWQKRDSYAAAVFKDKIWLVGGLDGNDTLLRKGSVEYWNSQYFSDIWNTENGKDWQLITENAPWGKRRSMQIIVFKDKLWLMGGWGPEIGYNNDIWYSEDGVSWILATSDAAWPAIEGHQMVFFKDKIWMMGGVRYDTRTTRNDVWYSEDGVNWIQATSAAQWSPRWDHAVTVFKDKIWLTGGMDLNNKIYNDVWYSEDGVNWLQATSAAPWQKRQGHGSVVFWDKLWVIGRFNDVFNNGDNDVWYTNDGTDWQKTDSDPSWLGREDFTAVVFKEKIWIFGGMDSNWQWVNDVWYSAAAGN